MERCGFVFLERPTAANPLNNPVLPLILAAAVAGILGGVLGGFIVAFVDDDRPPTAEETAVEVAAILAETEASEEETAPVEMTIEATTQAILPSLVSIRSELSTVTALDGSLITREQRGTGLIFDDAGYILTNQHNIAEALSIQVELPNGELRRATVVGDDAPFNDVAVLEILPGGLQPIVAGTPDTLSLGQSVIVIGYLLGDNTPMVSAGVVSNVDTQTFRAGVLQEDVIQTDAALNLGNSGGALVTRRGEVVGLNTSVLRTTETGDTVDGVGYAIQIDVALEIARRIVQYGDVARPDFGVLQENTVDSFTLDQLGISANGGAFLIEITRDGPLANAGLRPGDIILSVAGLQISEELPYLNVLRRLDPSQPAEIVYARQSDREIVAVTATPLLRNR